LDCHNQNTLGVSHDFGNLLPLTSFTQNPGYTISSFPANLFLKLAAGFNFVATKISVIPFNGFDGIVTFSVAGLPTGVTATFDPGDTPSTRMLTLTASPQTPTGISTVTVLSFSGKLTNFTTVSLSVSNNSSNLGASVGGPP
jgi:hypothetical protein